MIICQTPFRVSFFGGGTDWPEFFLKHGGAVLGTTIDKYIYHSMTSFYSALFDYSIRLAYKRVECIKSVDHIEHRPFREILRHFNITRDIEISLASDLPAYTGLGSSSSFTGAIDFPPRPIFAAAALVISITRPACVGPRSLTLTSTVLLFFVLVTFTIVPNASEGCAAVSLLWLNTSPLAVLRPASLSE